MERGWRSSSSSSAFLALLEPRDGGGGGGGFPSKGLSKVLSKDIKDAGTCAGSALGACTGSGSIGSHGTCTGSEKASFASFGNDFASASARAREGASKPAIWVSSAAV